MEIVRDVPKLQPRPVDGHKGTFGRVLVVAGSIGMTGAAALVGRAALRAGAGLVRVATAKSALPIVASIEPSYTTLPLAEDNAGRVSSKAINAILNAAEENDVVAIGPGMGQSPGLRCVVETLIQQEGLRLLIDGDGLNNLSQAPRLAQETQGGPGPDAAPRRDEAAVVGPVSRGNAPRSPTDGRTSGPSHPSRRRSSRAPALSSQTAQRLYVNTTGNPGMGTAGAGDVLTGITSALMGQGLSNFDATVLGVYVHGLAGDLAAAQLGQVSLIATDLIDFLPEAFKRL